MFIPYLTLHGTSVDFPHTSNFCSLYVTFFSPLVEPQLGADHMILPLYVTPRLPRATYPVAIQHAVHPHISHCYTDNSSGVLGGDGLCETAFTRALVVSKRRAPLTQRHSVTALKTAIVDYTARETSKFLPHNKR